MANNLISRVSIVETQVAEINKKIDDDRNTAEKYRNRMEEKLDELHKKTDANREHQDTQYYRLSRYVWVALGALAAFEFILKYAVEIKKHIP